MALRYRLRVAKVHLRKVAASAQRLVNQADALEEVRPFQVGDQPHAGDDVADGDVRGALPLVLIVHDRSTVVPLRGKLLLQPHQCRRDRGILIPQPLHQLDDESHVQSREIVVVAKQGAGIRWLAIDAQQAVRHVVRFLACSASAEDAIGGAPQILDQHDAQRDRDGPQFANGQRAARPGRRARSGAAFPARNGCRYGQRMPRRCRTRADSP